MNNTDSNKGFSKQNEIPLFRSDQTWLVNFPESDNSPDFPHGFQCMSAGFFSSSVHYFQDILVISRKFFDSFGKRSGERNDIFCQLFFQVAVTNRAIVIFSSKYSTTFRFWKPLFNRVKGFGMGPGFGLNSISWSGTLIG